jgi:hypothetical protein
LNQLTGVTRAGSLLAAGSSSSGVTTNVTVNSQAAVRDTEGFFYRKDVALADGTNAVTATAQDSLSTLIKN